MKMKSKTMAKPVKRTFPRPAGKSRFTLKQIDDGWKWVWEQEKKEAELHAALPAN